MLLGFNKGAFFPRALFQISIVRSLLRVLMYADDGALIAATVDYLQLCGEDGYSHFSFAFVEFAAELFFCH